MPVDYSEEAIKRWLDAVKPSLVESMQATIEGWRSEPEQLGEAIAEMFEMLKRVVEGHETPEKTRDQDGFSLIGGIWGTIAVLMMHLCQGKGPLDAEGAPSEPQAC